MTTASSFGNVEGDAPSVNDENGEKETQVNATGSGTFLWFLYFLSPFSVRTP